MPSRWPAALLVLALTPACMPPTAKVAAGGIFLVPAAVLLVDGATYKSKEFLDLRGGEEMLYGGIIGLVSLGLLAVGGLQLYEQHVNERRADRLAQLPGDAPATPMPDDRRVEVMRTEARLGHCDVAAAISRRLDRAVVVEALGDDEALRRCAPRN